MASDRSWMSARNRWSLEYRNGVKEFFDIAKNQLNDRGLVRCPCKKCGNVKFLPINAISMHLFNNGIKWSYKVWHYHGEALSPPPDVVRDQDRDEIADILEDVYAEDDVPTGNYNDHPQDDVQHR